jgi:hypothetical protein
VTKVNKPSPVGSSPDHHLVRRCAVWEARPRGEC